MSFAALASTFWFRCYHSDQPEIKKRTAPRHQDRKIELQDQLLRSQLDLTWSLATLTRQLRSDDARLSNEIYAVMGATLRRAEHYSQQTTEHEAGLIQLESFKKRISALGLCFSTTKTAHAVSIGGITR